MYTLACTEQRNAASRSYGTQCRSGSVKVQAQIAGHVEFLVFGERVVRAEHHPDQGGAQSVAFEGFTPAGGNGFGTGHAGIVHIGAGDDVHGLAFCGNGVGNELDMAISFTGKKTMNGLLVSYRYE